MSIFPEDNRSLHTDYLNYRMKSIENRHKHLAHATSYKLRHTDTTLTRQSGPSLEQISEALTHSDTPITKTYVNTPNVIKMPIVKLLIANYLKNGAVLNGVNSGVNNEKRRFAN